MHHHAKQVLSVADVISCTVNYFTKRDVSSCQSNIQYNFCYLHEVILLKSINWLALGLTELCKILNDKFGLKVGLLEVNFRKAHFR